MSLSRERAPQSQLILSLKCTGQDIKIEIDVVAIEMVKEVLRREDYKCCDR